MPGFTTASVVATCSPSVSCRREEGTSAGHVIRKRFESSTISPWKLRLSRSSVPDDEHLLRGENIEIEPSQHELGSSAAAILLGLPESLLPETISDRMIASNELIRDGLLSMQPDVQHLFR